MIRTVRKPCLLNRSMKEERAGFRRPGSASVNVPMAEILITMTKEVA